jgi:alcohol dehydrogenase class IV
LKPRHFLKPGAIYHLKDILREINPRHIFLVSGKNSYLASGADRFLKPILKNYPCTRFYDFETNPDAEDVKIAREQFLQKQYDLIIAVGGGSVLDMAKLIKYSLINKFSFLDYRPQEELVNSKNIPLIAIPTTSGSGSEATQFAVLYINGVKHSIEDRRLVPEIAIIDPDLTFSLPARLTAMTGMDALCQAVESYWSVNSTAGSKNYAREAIQLILPSIEQAVHKPSPTTRFAMSKSSYLAGKAINISKTTAPHALSYYLTSRLGIPHGQAVSLTLGEFFIFNDAVSDNDIMDSRGVEYVKKSMKELFKLLKAENAMAAAGYITNFMENIGLQTKLTQLVSKEKINLDVWSENINYERLSNNPRKMTKQQCKSILNKVL